MGCGISTANLPSYMRGGRNPATKRNGQLGFNDDDDDHNVAIMGRSTYSSAIDLLDDDPTSNQKISISPPDVEDHQKRDINVDEKQHDSNQDKKIKVSSSHKNLPKLVIPKEKEVDIGNENKNVSERNNLKGRDEKEENEESEYDHGSNIGNSSWIGSPSFRDYCGNSRDFGDSDEKGDEENKETKTQGGLNQASPKPQDDNLACSVEKSETINNKNEGLPDSNSTDSDGRRRRGSGFKKVFPNGKTAALKNFATCYNPNNATSRVGDGR